MTTRVKSFKQLEKRVLILPLVQPVTGEIYEVEMRELTQPEVNAFLYIEERPKPPIKEFKKNGVTGTVEPVFDMDNLMYQRAVSDWNNRFLYRWIIASWIVDEMPGGTIEEQMAALDQSIPSWVIARFREKLEEISGLRDSDIAFEKKKLLRITDTGANLELPTSGE